MSASGQSLGEAILHLGTDQSGLDRGLSDAEGKVGSFGSRAAAAVGKLAVFGLAAQGITQLGGALQHVSGFLSSFVSDADASAQVMAQTEAVIKSTGDASGLTAKQVADLATSLSNINPIDDEVIQSVTNMLLTFKNIGGTLIPEVTQTALDMAQALGTDATDGAIQLGKALNDPLTGLTALQRVGVTFTESQKSVIQSLVETGQIAKAQKIILTELNSEFGGSSTAAAKTFGGQMTILQTKIGNVKETLGSAFLPELTQLVSTVSDDVLPAVQRFSDWFTTLPGPVKQAILIIGGVVTVMAALVPAAGAAIVAFGALNASLGVVGLIAIVITALITAIGLLIVNWDTITAHVPILGTAIDVIKESFIELVNVIVGSVRVGIDAVKGFGLTVAGVFDGVKAVVQGTGTLLSDFFSLKFNKLPSDITAISDAVDDAKSKISRGFAEITHSVDAFNASSGDAADAIRQMGGAAEAKQSGIGIFGNAVAGLTSTVNGQVDALNDWTEAQRAVDGAVKKSSDAVDLWTQKQSAAQKALDDLDAIKKKDGSLNADQQAQYDTLTQYVARLGNGITDDLQPAYISAQVASAKFQQTQDKLNDQLAHGQITQDQYNKAVAAAKDASQAALDPATKLANANADLGAIVDKLNDSLHDMMIAMGLIKPPPPVTITDDGTIDRTKGKLLEMNDVVIKTPSKVTTTVYADTSGAIDALDAVHKKAYDSTFTITAQVNSGPFEEAIAKIDRMIPHSPAKEGPLSQEPNWSWVFQGIASSAAQFTDDALTHLTNFANTAKGIWDALKSQVSVSADINAFESSGGTLPSDDFITQLTLSAKHAIQSMGDTAALYSGDFLDATDKLGQAVQSAYGGLSAQVAFAKDLAGAGDAVDQFTAESSDIQSRLKFSAEQAVQSFGDSAAVLGTDGVANASAFGDAVERVYGGLGAALSFAKDAAGALAGNVNLTDSRIDDVLDKLASLSERAGKRFAQIGQDEADNLDAAKAAGDALGAPFSALSAALSFVKDVSAAAQGQLDLIVPDGVLASLSGLIRRMTTAFVSANKGLDTDTLTQAKALSDSLSAPFQVYEDALSFVKDATADAATAFPPTISDRFIANLTDTITRITAGFKQAAQQIGTDGLDDATALANALGPILSIVKPLTDGIQALTSQSRLQDRPLETFKANIGKLLDTIGDLRQDAQEHLSDALIFQQTMEAIAGALTAASSAIASIQGLNKSGLSTAAISQVLTLMGPAAIAGPSLSTAAASAVQVTAAAPQVTLDFAPTFNITLGNNQFTDYVVTVVNQVLRQKATATY